MSTTTPLQIKNHPSNTSTSKHHWTFSKANRFPSPKSNCSKSFYEHRSCLSERKASIGVGDRSAYFRGQKEGPEPGKYQLGSDFNSKTNKKGFSFTANRQNLKFDHYAKTMQVTPAPQAYNQDSAQVKHTTYYSMRPKTAYPKNYFLPNKHEAQIQKTLPGPGKYETIDCIGTKYHTRSPNNHAQTFSSSHRFRTDKLTPGPLDYPNKTIEPDGIYFLSNMKSSGRRSFLNGRRKLKLDGNRETPGPGSYRAPSDFGHYEQPLQPNSTITSSIRPSKRPSTAFN